MDISLIIRFVVTTLLFSGFQLHAQLTVDTSFIYANYAYKNGRLDFPKEEILRLIPQAKEYDIKLLSVYDGDWTFESMQCNCEIDLQKKKLTINMPHGYPQLKISYDSTLQITGTIDFERDLSDDWNCLGDNNFPRFGGLYPEEAGRIFLTLNHNPLSLAPPKREDYLYTNKILEGYGLFVERNQSPHANAHPFLFRCLLKQKEVVSNE